MSGFRSSDPAGRDPAPTLDNSAAFRDEPLGLTVHALPDPRQLPTRQRHWGRAQMLLVAAICAAPMVLSYLAFYVVKPKGGEAAYGELVAPSVPMPELTARSLAGEPVALGTLKDQWLLVAVDGGACDAGCEARLFMQRQLREMTGRERDRVDKLWLVIDDQPVSSALRAALAASPAMHVLRVPRAAVAAWLSPAQGQRLEDHLYVVDPMGQWMMRVPPKPEPAKVKRDLERLLRASGSWDQPGRVAARLSPAAAAPQPAPAASMPASSASAGS